MEQVLLVVQVIVTLALIAIVLIQRSDSDGFGLSGGSGNNLMSGRASASAMTRITAILAAIFMANALLLGVIAARGHSSSIAESIEEDQTQAKDVVPSVPAAGETKAPKKEEVKKEAAKPEAKKEEAPAVPAADAEPAPAPKAKKPAAKAADEFDPNAATNANE